MNKGESKVMMRYENVGRVHFRLNGESLEELSGLFDAPAWGRK